MSIPTIERVSGVNPLLRRDHPLPPAADSLHRRREEPGNPSPRERERKRHPDPDAAAPAIAPHATIPHIVDTFAGHRSRHHAALYLR
jgi:hypothetical protein